MVPHLTNILIGVLTLSATRLLVQTNEDQKQFERTEHDVVCASCGKDPADSVSSSATSESGDHVITYNEGKLTVCTGLYVVIFCYCCIIVLLYY